MKLISWNVNGIRAAIKKGFLDYFNEQNADIFCLQETKLSAGQLDLELKGYHHIGTMQKKRVIQVLQFLQNKSLYLLVMV